MRYYKLDAVIKQGDTYYTGPKHFLRIEAIGTDASSDAYLTVEERPTGPIINEIAPLHATGSNMLGPMELGDLWYTVPPSSKFAVGGATGAKLRLKGWVGVLERGEAAPGDIYGRFENQDHHYVTYEKQTYSHGTDESIADGEEVEIFSITPNPDEYYTLFGPLMLKIENVTISEGDVAVRFYYEDSPLDVLSWEPGPIIAYNDFKSFPYPPNTTDELTPWSFKDTPIEVKPNEKFAIKIRNVSGSALTPTSGTSITVTTLTPVIYKKVLK